MSLFQFLMYSVLSTESVYVNSIEDSWTHWLLKCHGNLGTECLGLLFWEPLLLSLRHLSVSSDLCFCSFHSNVEVAQLQRLHQSKELNECWLVGYKLWPT